MPRNVIYPSGAAIDHVFGYIPRAAPSRSCAIPRGARRQTAPIRMCGETV